MVRLLSLLVLALLLLSNGAGCGNRGSTPVYPEGGTPVNKVEPRPLPETIAKIPTPETKGKTATATIEVIFPAELPEFSLMVEGKEVPVGEDEKKEGVYEVVTPELDVGKTFVYKIEATIEPNNYTKIIRTREVRFKGGEKVKVDIRKKDPKIKDKVLIRWVPTPKVVVKDMCELAKVGPNDVVMDPGCGDAIMIITAVKDFKAKRGKGTDIDPVKVKESQERIEKEGLKDKITIKHGDALKLTAEDLKDVTVMMVYMGDELNIRLRPTLWEHLPVGARVVSHRFLMGDWAPDKSITVNREGDYGVEDFDLHVWTITGKEKKGEYKKRKVTDNPDATDN